MQKDVQSQDSCPRKQRRVSWLDEGVDLGSRSERAQSICVRPNIDRCVSPKLRCHAYGADCTTTQKTHQHKNTSSASRSTCGGVITPPLSLPCGFNSARSLPNGFNSARPYPRRRGVRAQQGNNLYLTASYPRRKIQWPRGPGPTQVPPLMAPSPLQRPLVVPVSLGIGLRLVPAGLRPALCKSQAGPTASTF